MSGESHNTLTKLRSGAPAATVELSPDHVRLIDQCCDQFESAIRDGAETAIAAVVNGQTEPVRSVLLKQLLLLDWEYRQAQGRPLSTDDYLRDFPQDRPLIEGIFEELARTLESTVTNSRRSSVRIHASADGPMIDANSLHYGHPVQRYEREAEIGRGGIGVVQRGHDRMLNRTVAIKSLRENYRNNREAYERFTTEAQICSRLQHPAIIPIYDLGHLADGQPFFVMKLIEGRTLSELLKQRPAPSHELSRFLGIFEQVCQAVAYAHTQNIVHRDLKPANVMVGPFGEVQVMDWGFAKQLQIADQGWQNADFRLQIEESQPGGDGASTKNNGKMSTSNASATESGALMGTPAYMSPEQARGQVDRVDLRSDVYSLGAILCEILTGEPPFRGSAESVRAQAAGGAPQEVADRLSRCSADRELGELTQHCLQTERADRPTDAGVVAVRITSYLTSAQEQLHQAQVAKAAADAQAEQLSAKVLAERRARRFMLGLTSALVLLIAVAGGAYWWQDRVHRENVVRASAIATKIEAALAEANESVSRKDWVQAETAALRAKDMLIPGEVSRWRESVDQLCDDLNLIKRMNLVLVAQARFDPVRRQHNRPIAVPAYEKVFITHKLAPPIEERVVAARIAAKPPAIREAIIAGMDNWRMHAFQSEPKLFAWIDAVLQEVDTDDWRRQTRQAVTNNDRAALIELAGRDDAVEQPPVSITMMSWALRELKEYDAALALLRQAHPRHPSDFWINMEIAQCQMRKPAPDIRELGQHYRTAWSLRPDSINYITLCMVFHDCKDYDNMLIAAKKAVELSPKDPSAHYHRGVALGKKGRLEEAEQAHGTAVRLDNKNHLYQFGHAVCLIQNGRIDEGIAAYQRAIKLAPNDAEYYFNLGIAHEKNNDLPAAETAYRKATALKPDYSEAHCNLGIVLGKLDRIDESIACHETALKLKPGYFDYWNNLGGARHRKKQYDLAITAFRRAIELDPNKAIAWENLGIVMKSKADWVETVRAFREAIKLDPNNSEAHIELGNALIEDGEFADGLAAIQRGRQLSQDNAQLQTRTAPLLKNAERLADMEKRLPAVIARELKPTSIEEKTEFARISSRKGLTAAAASLFSEVFEDRPTKPISEKHYEAIRCAAWAGYGKGKDAPKSDAEKSKWREQTYQWLHADLEFYRQRNNDATDRAIVQKKLRNWRTDRGLEHLREPTLLARWPESESKKWLAFWAEVDAVLSQSVADSNSQS